MNPNQPPTTTGISTRFDKEDMAALNRIKRHYKVRSTAQVLRDLVHMVDQSIRRKKGRAAK